MEPLICKFCGEPIGKANNAQTIGKLAGVFAPQRHFFPIPGICVGTMQAQYIPGQMKGLGSPYTKEGERLWREAYGKYKQILEVEQAATSLFYEAIDLQQTGKYADAYSKFLEALKTLRKVSLDEWDGDFLTFSQVLQNQIQAEVYKPFRETTS